MRYPLREWGLSREDCGRIIVNAGLPLPPKSACFFCPAMKEAEIRLLAETEPEYYRMALEMERLYREGRHFRGDNYFTVKAKHQVTGEKEELEMLGENEADIRQQFRTRFGDTKRPYKYKLGIYPAVVGLGRRFAWKRIPLQLAS